ncbi:hypothetical protein [Billgrantia endophytica]|uniref:hypothetical protein n=1 Tax=Billgrantia endophytica TaxID=2033802 RepID=UPI0013FE0415|nr:hypothetical protein [Halomonas endophytica]
MALASGFPSHHSSGHRASRLMLHYWLERIRPARQIDILERSGDMAPATLSKG